MFEKLNAILATEGIPPLVMGTLETTPQPITSQEELRSCLVDFGAAEGWLCLTDEVIEVGKGFDFDRLKGRVILSGEVAGDDRSLHLRQQNSGWVAVEIRRGASADSYITEQCFLPARGSSRLRYEICWRVGANGTLSPMASRFAGFAAGGDEA